MNEENHSDDNAIKLKLEHFNILFQYYLKLIDHDQHLRNFYLSLNTLIISGISYLYIKENKPEIIIFLSAIAVVIDLFWFRSTCLIKAMTDSCEKFFIEMEKEGDGKLLRFFEQRESDLAKYKEGLNKYSMFPLFFSFVYFVFGAYMLFSMKCHH